MTDREKVIKEFADYVHYFKPYCIGDIEDYAMLKDALALLKKQVQKETPMTMERINVVKVDGNDFYKGFCPACQTLQYGIKSKYCDQCGQAVKWDDK